MARRSAINPVAVGVFAAINTPALRALCPGGVYRARPTAQVAPWCSVGPCEETPADYMGLHYGAVVGVPVKVYISGADADGESRAVTILDKAMELLDEPASVTATGWTVMGVEYVGARPEPYAFEDGSEGYAMTATFAITVRQT